MKEVHPTTSEGGSRPRRGDTAVIIVISSLSMLLYVNTIHHQFVYDDRPAVVDNPLVTGAGAGAWQLATSDYWGVPLSHAGSHKSWRPVTSLSFRLNMLAAGPRPATFHLANLLLHGAVTAAFLHLVSRLAPQLVAVAGLCWAVMPVHCEAVAGVVGRADLLATLLALLTLLHHTRRGGAGWSPATPLLAALAMLAKEQGVTVLGVAAVLDLVAARWRSLRMTAATAALLLSCRAACLGGELPSFSRADNPASHAAAATTRGLTFLHLPALNLGLVVLPATLSYDWSMSAVPLVSSWADPRNLLSLGLYSLLGCLTSKLVFPLYQLHQTTFSSLWRSNLSKSCARTSRPTTSQIEAISIIALALSLIILPFLPAANIFFYVGFVVAERLLYLPSLGVCLLLAQGYRALAAHRRCRGVAALSLRLGLAVMLVSSGLRTLTRNLDWRDEETLFKSGLAVNPPKSFSNLGNILYAKGDLEDAEACFKEAILHRPNMADTHYNLGILLQKTGRLTEAAAAYSRAISHRPKLALAHLNLGVTLADLGRKEDAIKILSDCSKLDDNGLKDPKTNANARISAVWHLGKLLIESGAARRAVAVLEHTVRSSRGSSGVSQLYHLLGEGHEALGELGVAEAWYSAAIETSPAQPGPHLMMARMLARNESRHQEAETWFQRAKAAAPAQPNVYVQYGLYLMDQQRFPEAAALLGHAASLTPGHYDNAFNAAVAHRQAGQLDEAEAWYRQTVRMRPMEAGSHLNLGALLHLRGKLREAEQEYLQAWTLRPGDQSTRINIQRLHNVMRKKNLTISNLVDL